MFAVHQPAHTPAYLLAFGQLCRLLEVAWCPLLVASLHFVPDTILQLGCGLRRARAILFLSLCVSLRLFTFIAPVPVNCLPQSSGHHQPFRCKANGQASPFTCTMTLQLSATTALYSHLICFSGSYLTTLSYVLSQLLPLAYMLFCREQLCKDLALISLFT